MRLASAETGSVCTRVRQSMICLLAPCAIAWGWCCAPDGLQAQTRQVRFQPAPDLVSEELPPGESLWHPSDPEMIYNDSYDGQYYYDEPLPGYGYGGAPIDDLAGEMVNELGRLSSNAFLFNPHYPPEHSCPVVDPPGLVCDRTWYVEAGPTALLRQRPRLRSLSAVVDSIDTGGGVPFVFLRSVMTTKSADFNAVPGMRLTVGKYLGRDPLYRDHSLEFTYLGLNEWDESTQVLGQRVAAFNAEVGSLFSAFADINTGFIAKGFDNTDLQGFRYRSDFNDFELSYRTRRVIPDRLVADEYGNWIPRGTPGLTTSMLAGFRYLTINEDFHWFARGQIIDNPGQVNQQVNDISGDYTIRTENRLFGFQVGGELIQDNCFWTWGFRGKAGMFVNFANQSQSIVTVDNSQFHDNANTLTPDRSFSADDEALAFIGELGPVISWRITPRLVTRLAYDFMWVQTVALAPEQIDVVNDAPRVNIGGHSLFQGASVTVDWSW